VGQGDLLTGRIRRDELAAIVVAALDEPSACGATFEVRRAEAPPQQAAATLSAPLLPSPASLPAPADLRRELTLVHLSAQLERLHETWGSVRAGVL